MQAKADCTGATKCHSVPLGIMEYETGCHQQ